LTLSTQIHQIRRFAIACCPGLEWISVYILLLCGWCFLTKGFTQTASHFLIRGILDPHGPGLIFFNLFGRVPDIFVQGDFWSELMSWVTLAKEGVDRELSFFHGIASWFGMASRISCGLEIGIQIWGMGQPDADIVWARYGPSRRVFRY
jgi:hypothetical protein